MYTLKTLIVYRGIMPGSRTSLATKISKSDQLRLEQICQLENKTKAEVLREALRYYMDRKETNLLDERDSLLEKRIKRMEDRLASLMVKVGLDVGTLHQLFWSRADQDGRDELFTQCYISAVKRLKKKLNPDEKNLADRAADNR